MNADYATFPNHDAIFRLGELERQPGEIRIAHPNHRFAGPPPTVATVDVMVAMKQRATIVVDVERLIDKDRLSTRQLVPPEIKCCEKHNRLCTDSPHVSNACTPVRA